MIFVTLGSQKFQFNRLLEAVDNLVAEGRITEEVYAQIGYSNYEPQHFVFKQFLDREEFSKMTERADIVITHGGTGAIIGAVKKGKKVIALPRLAQYGEHVDDHQLQILKQFDGMGIILACYDLNDLAELYKKIQHIEMTPYQSNTVKIIDSIEKFLSREFDKHE